MFPKPRHRLERFVVLILLLLLGSSATLRAQTPTPRAPTPSEGTAVQGSGAIQDGGVIFRYDITGEAGALTDFEVPAGTDHLAASWWWYRVSGDAAESRLPPPDGESYVGDRAVLTWNDVDGRGFGLTLVTTVRDGSGGDGLTGVAISQVTIHNPGGAPLALDLFFHANINLTGTSPSDVASLISANNHILIEEGLTNAEMFGLGGGAYEVAIAPAIQDALNDGASTNLSNSGLPFGPGDFSGALQWTLNAPAGGETTIGACLAINQSCAGASVTITQLNQPPDGTDIPFQVNGPDPDPTFLSKWGTKGAGPSQLFGPTGIAIDANGRVYVADSNNDRVQVFGPAGTPLATWGSSGSGNGDFMFPNGITVDDANGWVYITDADNDRVQKFDFDGAFLLAWGTEGGGDGQFQFPADVVTDAAGLVYVADSSNHRVQVFDSNGNFQFNFGAVGGGNGEFISPRGIAIDNLGRIFVADTFNNRVQRFGSAGQFELAWGGFGSGNGQFDATLDVNVDSLGRVYVTDLGNNRVQVFDGDGNFLHKWGSAGLGDGEYFTVNDVALDGANNIYTTDSSADNVQRFASLGFPLDDANPDDNDGVPGSQTLYDLPAGVWTFTSDAPVGWNVISIVCQSDDPADSSTTDVSSGMATLAVDVGEHFACTFSSAAYSVYLPIIRNGSP